MEFLGKNTEKYETVLVPLEEEIIKADKDNNENIVAISCKTNFIVSARFMANLQDSLSNLVDNLAKEFSKLTVKIPIAFLNMTVSMTT